MYGREADGRVSATNNEATGLVTTPDGRNPVLLGPSS